MPDDKERNAFREIEALTNVVAELESRLSAFEDALAIVDHELHDAVVGAPETMPTPEPPAP